MRKPEDSLTKLHDYRVLFMAFIGIMALIVASPALSRLLVYTRTEFYTQMWLLGPNHMVKDYPFNVTIGQNYNIFLGIANHLGHCAYYVVEVKFRNQTQLASDGSEGSPSALPSLLNVTAFVADEQVWERSFSFSFDYLYNAALLRVELRSLTLNNNLLTLRDFRILSNSMANGFLGNLFFELWIYNPDLGIFQYHYRSVGIWLNMIA
jgi:hypothetical protein